MDKEMLVIIIVGVLLVISVIQAFQLNSLIYKLENAPVVSASGGDQSSQDSADDPQAGLQNTAPTSAMVGGC